MSLSYDTAEFRVPFRVIRTLFGISWMYEKEGSISRKTDQMVWGAFFG
jgi:hypothetical protein